MDSNITIWVAIVSILNFPKVQYGFFCGYMGYCSNAYMDYEATIWVAISKTKITKLDLLTKQTLPMYPFLSNHFGQHNNSTSLYHVGGGGKRW